MTYTFTNTYSFSGYTGNTRAQYRIIISTGCCQWLGNNDRLGLTTGWVKSLIYAKNTRSCIMTSTGYYRLPSNHPSKYSKKHTVMYMTSTGHDRLLTKDPRKNLGLRSTASVSNTPTRPCFAHRPDYSSVFTYGLSRTQYNCSNNIRRISGYRTLAYRASHNITRSSLLDVEAGHPGIGQNQIDLHRTWCCM